MNVRNTISISQEICRPACDHISRKELSAAYESVYEATQGLAGLAEMAFAMGSNTIEGGRLYYLLDQQDRYIQQALMKLEALL